MLTLTLKASSTDDSTGKTIIYVSIPPENQLVAPKFSQAFYTATYDLNAEAGSIIKVDPAITVTEDAEVTISGKYLFYKKLQRYKIFAHFRYS